MKATFKKHTLIFKQPGGTSRGVLHVKETWFLILNDKGKFGIGECSPLKGLSIDDRPDYEGQLDWICLNIHLGKDLLWEKLKDFPSLQFGVETAFLSFSSDDPFVLFPSDFTQSKNCIPINGLVWMGDFDFMKQQIEDKIMQGFKCIKLKIGALDFEKELELLRLLRQEYNKDDIEIRVDANGAFSFDKALRKLSQLSEFDLHSIEQPISKNQHDSMSVLCKSSNLDVALDEELIGIIEPSEKKKMLEKISPQYIVLKPSLVGGFRGTMEWIEIAQELNIGWWITSALESNIGLNAISQWTFMLNNPMPQGLGTGSVFKNNFESPLEVSNGCLYYNSSKAWKISSEFTGI